MTLWRDPLPDPAAGTFWAGLTPADREVLTTAGSVRAMPRNSLLHSEGSARTQVRVLLSGRVELFRDDAAGRRTVLAIQAAGELLGELSAIDRLPVPASAVVTEAGCALELPPERFAALCREHTELGWAVTVAIVRRLRLSNDERVRLRAEVRDRTVFALVDLAGAGPGPAVVRVTQQRLADLVSASLVSVTRALDDLRVLGAISTDRGRITVADPAALRTLLPDELR